MNTIKRITVICFAVIVLAANLPLCASATDPVSAATMANALAQAITAYGASQGVSMTFDVASTDGIGEGVHELWDQFVENVNDPNTPTYDSLAVTMWSNLYSKIGNNLGVNISASEMPFIDSFWNWLLSGPAEMTKVDDQYYEWSYGQNNVVTPISVYTELSNSMGDYVLYELPITISLNNSSFDYLTIENGNVTNPYVFFATSSSSIFAYIVSQNSMSSSNYVYKYFMTNGNIENAGYQYSRGSTFTNGIYYIQIPSVSGSTNDVVVGLNPPDSYLSGNDIIDSTVTSDISVQPYIGDSTPQNVYIPDNTDVNYNPTDVAIPLDIPWDNTLFGDGDGVLTDAQSEAAAAAADDAITDSLEKTLTLADTENPDIPAPSEVYIPLLPVELPSFNFSLSGIWHYVVSWVQSLGAWLSLMFQTWAVLPSAITIPVYATAVIVIVLGVYKRFFM